LGRPIHGSPGSRCQTGVRDEIGTKGMAILPRCHWSLAGFFTTENTEITEKKRTQGNEIGQNTLLGWHPREIGHVRRRYDL
jgi:hypothetical protein